MNVLENQKKENGTLLDNKVLKGKQLEGGLTLKVMKNSSSERIFVEFSSPDGKLVVQRSYQDNLNGRTQAEKFEGSFKSLDDLKKYFKIK